MPAGLHETEDQVSVLSDSTVLVSTATYSLALTAGMIEYGRGDILTLSEPVWLALMRHFPVYLRIRLSLGGGGCVQTVWLYRHGCGGTLTAIRRRQQGL